MSAGLEQWAPEILHALATALAQFLSQGTAVGLAAAALLVLMKRKSARSRYCVACGALVLLAILPGATFWNALREGPQGARVANILWPALHNPEPARDHVPRVPVRSGALPRFETAPPPSAVSSLQARAAPWLMVAWALGVFSLSVRMLAGWLRVMKLAQVGTRVPNEIWTRALQAARRRVRTSLPVRLLESVSVEVPTVVGFLRPLILVPVSALSGLTPAQLEAVLAHELAHIQRHDYLVNLLQSAVETLLFYHPVVWWLSNRIRIERELCCDDLAVRSCGDAILYARALTALEVLRAVRLPVAMAANGGSLLSRVRRLLDIPEPNANSGWRVLGIFGALAVTVLLAAAQTPGNAVAAEKQKARALPRLDAPSSAARAAPPLTPPTLPTPADDAEEAPEPDAPAATLTPDERGTRLAEARRQADAAWVAAEQAEREARAHHTRAEALSDVQERWEAEADRQQEAADTRAEEAQEQAEAARERAEAHAEREHDRRHPGPSPENADDADDTDAQENSENDDGSDDSEAPAVSSSSDREDAPSDKFSFHFRGPGAHREIEDLSREMGELGQRIAQRALSMHGVDKEARRRIKMDIRDLEKKLQVQGRTLAREAQRLALNAQPKWDRTAWGDDAPVPPAPPASAPTAPSAPPAPPSVSTRRLSFGPTSIGETRSWVWRTDKRTLSASSHGTWRQTTDRTGYAWGGSSGAGELTVSEVRGADERRVAFARDASGKVTVQFLRQRAPWDEAAGRAWLKGLMPDLPQTF